MTDEFKVFNFIDCKISTVDSLIIYNEYISKEKIGLIFATNKNLAEAALKRQEPML